MNATVRCLLLLGPLLAGGCSNRCGEPSWYYDWSFLEIGVGNRDFIDVPWGVQVSPDSTSPPYFNVALKGTGMSHTGLFVELEAWVGETRYARNLFDRVDLQCGRHGSFEVAGLKLELDPATLPPMTAGPDPNFPDEDVLTPRESADTGWWQEGPGGDVRIVADVTDRQGERTHGETFWFVYR